MERFGLCSRLAANRGAASIALMTASWTGMIVSVKAENTITFRRSALDIPAGQPVVLERRCQ